MRHTPDFTSTCRMIDVAIRNAIKAERERFAFALESAAANLGGSAQAAVLEVRRALVADIHSVAGGR